MCALKKDDFCSKAPVFVGDILWEHLLLLQAECDKEEPRSALKNAAPKISETAVAELPVSAPRSYTPYSPPRNYTNLDSNKVYSSPMKPLSTQVPSNNTYYQHSTESDLYRIDQRYQHPAAGDITHRPSPPPMHSSPSPPIKTEFDQSQQSPYGAYPYGGHYFAPSSRLYSSHQYPTYPPQTYHQTPYFMPPSAAALHQQQFENIENQSLQVNIINLLNNSDEHILIKE